MQDIDLKLLLESGAHFGHKTNKWHPYASKFIYKAVGDIHIIDLAITKDCLEKARNAVKKKTSEGKEVLFVGTKRQASAIVKEKAQSVDAPYITVRWIGGFMTNWQEVRKNIDKFNSLEKDLKDTNKMAKFTKRERTHMDRDRAKLEAVYGGVRNMEKIPDMLFVVDVRKERTAILEAKQNKKPIAGLVDTNTDSSMIDYPVPANDDAVGSIAYITELIAEAYKEGKEQYRIGVKEQEQKEAKEKEKQAKKETKAEEKEVKKANPKSK